MPVLVVVSGQNWPYGERKVRCVPLNSLVEFVRGCYKFCERLVEFMSEGILDLESSQWEFLELVQYPSYKFLGVFLFK